MQGRLISAMELDEETLRGIQERFSRMQGEPVEFHVEVDKSLLAGFVAMIGGNIQYDCSLKSRLEEIRRYLSRR